ncbi:MAG: glycoside hydrolase family 3 C-terminal domain-containing protein, partial [Oscillospiraceae bacterium]|nr:glycoside hydrolase family 3 C-terminal domain-containing protein [Oscillospiraceae bacterium]
MENRLDFTAYRALVRRVAAEGCVLLRNENKALPLQSGAHIALFGRAQSAYYKSGTGSGGMVNTRPVASIAEALEKEDGLTLDRDVLEAYKAFVDAHPFDKGIGWAAEPWNQAEMPLDPALAEEAGRRNDAAIVVIGRTAGEDQDNTAEKGSYYLTDEEDAMLRTVCASFARTIVLLNVGNIIDMRWAEEYKPAAVVYLWHGGEMGAYAAADILTGRETPSGKLADTIAREITDYPAHANYGDPARTPYCEDIYVGYRYFETFAKEKVLYPFGFGLSYTEFNLETLDFEGSEKGISLRVRVTNTGSYKGKAVVQVYCAAPQGNLGKSARVLCAFGKTELLAPGQAQELTLCADAYRLSSFDDSGASGYKDAYVLEKGEYRIYAGFDVRAQALAGSFTLDKTVVVLKLCEALAPVTPFKRLKPVETDNGYIPAYEDAPLRTIDLNARI